MGWKISIDKIRDLYYYINNMSDRKLKVYLDTAVVSHLWQLDAPVQMQQTL